MQVLQQSVAEQVVLLGLADDRRDRVESGALDGSPAPLPHHQLESSVVERSHHHGLQQPDLVDRLDEFVHRLLVEHGARLSRVGRDVRDRQLGEVRPRPARRRRRSAAGCVGAERRAAAHRFAGTVRPGPGRGRGVRWSSSCGLLGAPTGDLLSGFEVRDGAGRVRVVGEDGLAVAGRFGDPHRARNDRRQGFLAEVGADLVRRPGRRAAYARRTWSAAPCSAAARLFSSPLTRLIVRISCETPSSA